MSRVKSFTAQPRISNCTILPNEVYQLKLSATAFAVYSYLRRLADPETHQCWPSYANIADTFGCSKRTVGKYVAELCEAGLVGIEPTSVITADDLKWNGNLRYINRTGNHVLYRVTPLFAGDELVARGILMEAYSVEDGGAGVCFNVYVYNVQPGVVIDYATGESERAEAPVEQTEEISGYIGNVKSLKYHVPSCPNLPQRWNWITFDTEEEAVAQGYTPCGNCLGDRAAALAAENAA